ncbi:MAG: beta-eliminating lyase-related protein [Anaerolineae bacterium]
MPRTKDRAGDRSTALAGRRRNGDGGGDIDGGGSPTRIDAPDVPALAEDDLSGFLNRTSMLIGPDALAVLAGKTVAVAGCGGVGGAVAITLTRMGVGGFALADPAEFDAPDINRQWAATRRSLGVNKAETYADVLRSINPSVRLTTFTDGVRDDNLAAFLDGADIVIDCLDVAVSPMLRVQLYQQARARGLHCLTAPMLGFGAIIVNAAPDGMPMEALYGPIFAQAVATSKLPQGLRDLIVPEHVDAIERHLRNLRAPSVAVSPMLSASLICAEIFLILLGEGTPGWRPPHCLPDVMVVDPIRGTFQVLPLQDLVARSDSAPLVAPTADERLDLLAAAGRNTLRLPNDAIAVDLQSDSWAERTRPHPASATSMSTAPADAAASAPTADAAADVGNLLRARYGFAHAVPVYRGRFAEALLAKACITPGGTVLSNALFPTTRFHIESAGARVVEVGIPEADDLYDPHPFKGELDLVAVEAALAGGVGDDDVKPGAVQPPVQAIYVELCANAIGGHPVRLAHLRALRDLAAVHGVPLLLDATRAYANAALLREREPGQAGRPLADIVRDLCACGTACAASLAKDFVTAVGGFVGTNDAALYVAVRDLAMLAYGDGLRAGDRAAMAAALAVTPDDANSAHAARLATVRRLHCALTARAIPVVGPPGGHAVFVDAAAFLPHVGADGHRAIALTGALFAAGGVRAGVHLGTPRQQAAGVELVRLAVPAGGLGDDDIERVGEAFRRVYVGRAAIEGLRRVPGGAGGMIGELSAAYEPA